MGGIEHDETKFARAVVSCFHHHDPHSISNFIMAQYAQVAIDMPRVQDALKNPEEWDKQWETVLTQLDPSPEMVFLDSVRHSKMVRRSVSDLLEYYAILYTQTCEVQYRVGGRACAFLLHKDLERRWIEAGEVVRRKHALRALSEACSMAKNLNDARNSCGDILRLRKLSRDGKTLISLLQAMIPEDLSDVPKTPYYFPEPRWEALQGHVERFFPANSIERVTFDNAVSVSNSFSDDSLIDICPLISISVDFADKVDL